jgi:hypothetical protein
MMQDHILNLLEEVEGKLPEEKAKMLALIDRYLALTAEEKANFRVGRRTGIYRSLDDLFNPELNNQVEDVIRRIELEKSGGIEQALSDLMGSFI